MPDQDATRDEHLDRRRDYRVIGLTLALSAVYATLRYNVFKGVAWSDWPHYVGSKIAAVTALVLFGAAVFRLVRRSGPIRRLMATGSALALTHTLVSLGLFRPAYYDKYFAGQSLTLAGGISVVLGGAAMALLQWGKGRPGGSAPEAAAVPVGTLAFVSGLHAAAPSLSGWVTPATWPGGLPPITLISFLVGALALTLSLISRRRLSSSN